MKRMGRVMLDGLVGKPLAMGRALHADERGDNENLGRMLILALVLVPLVVLIAFFGDAIWKKGKCQWDQVMETDVTAGQAKDKTAGC